jgi:hypothetical protein
VSELGGDGTGLEPLSYDPVRRELSFVPEFFAAERSSRFVSWRPGVGPNTPIAIGTVLADIFWDNGKQGLVASPIAGIIREINDDIRQDLLDSEPQTALVLV